MKSANTFLVVLVAVLALFAFAAVKAYAQPPKPAAPAEAPKPAAPAEAPKPAAPGEAPKPGEAPPAEAPKPAEAPPAAPAPLVAAPAPAPAPAPATPGAVTTVLWINLILGLWLLVSSWVTKCEGGHKWSTAIVGLVVAVLSIWGLFA